MFLKPPSDKGISHTQGLKTWEGTYHCLYDGQLVLVIVKVDHVYPSCEMLGMQFCPEEGFDDLRIADYAKQAISQQAMNDYIHYAEKTSAALKRTAKLDDPFFEEHNDTTATSRRILPRTKQARRKTDDRDKQ